MSDSGESSNSSSISGWEFVNQQGNVQDDDDTDSTASSVEVVDEEEEELSQPISGTSPGSTPVGSPYRAPAVPRFILRLSSHEVLDSDDEQGSGQESSTPPPTAADHVTCQLVETPSSDLVEPTVAATETSSQASPSCSQSQTVIQDHVERLVEALDSVQGDLTQDQSEENLTSAETVGANDTPVTHCDNANEGTSADVLQQTTVENVGNQSTIDPTPGNQTDDDHYGQQVAENVGNQSGIDPIAGNQTDDDQSGQQSRAENEYSDEGRQQAEMPGSTNRAQDFFPEMTALQEALAELRIPRRWRQIAAPPRWCWILIVLVLLVWMIMFAVLAKLILFQFLGPVSQALFMKPKAETNPTCYGIERLSRCRMALGKLREEVWRSQARCGDYRYPFQDGDPGSSRSGQGEDIFEENLERTLRGNIEALSKINKEKDSINARLKKELATTRRELSEANIELTRLRDLERNVHDHEEMKRAREVPEQQSSRKQNEENRHGNNEHEEQADGQSSYSAQYQACLSMVRDMYQKEIVEKFGTSWSFTEYLRHDLSNDMAKAFSTISKTTADYFGYSQDPEHSSTDKNHKETSKPKGSGKFSQNEGKKSEKYAKHRNEYHSAGNDESQSESTGSGRFQSTGSAGTWSATVMDMMNKTKNQIHNTWEQVRENYEHLWEEHEPALLKMKNRFVNKLQHVSDKFQQKLAKKARKWFNYGKRRAQEADQNDPKPAGATGGTNRRPSEASGGISKDKYCTRLMKVYDQIDSLTVRKFRKLSKRSGDMDVLADLQELWELRHLHEDRTAGKEVDTWLECQQAWWSSYPKTALPLCIPYLSCWQVRATEGNVINCHKGEAKIWKAMHSVCSAPGKRQSHKAHPKTPTNGQQGTTNQEQAQNTGAINKNDEHYTSTSDGPPDSDNDNWLMARWKDREFHHSEPDDWYFRRNKKEFDVSPETHDVQEDQDWYQARAEARAYHHQEPDNWQFRRNEKHSDTVIKSDPDVPSEPDWDKLDL